MDGGFRDDPDARRGFPLPGSARRPIVTWTLLGVNATIWLVATAAGGTEDPDVLLDFGAMFGPLIAAGQYWRLFTAMFLHVGVLHLAFNGFGLLIFGPLVERAYGHLRFLTIYILAGLAGSVASYLANSIFDTIALAAGASGAIFGVLGALAAYFALQRRVFGMAAQRNLTGLLVLAGINLVYGLATPGIDNWAHLGGFAGGFALGLALAPQYRLVRSPIGTPIALADINSMIRRWWAVPIALVLLLIGTLLATASLPQNPHTHLYQAERYLTRQEYQMALEEIDEAVRLDDTIAEAYYLRGLIYADRGNIDAAVSELAKAAKYGRPGDRDIRQKAIRALIELRSRRR